MNINEFKQYVAEAASDVSEKLCDGTFISSTPVQDHYGYPHDYGEEIMEQVIDNLTYYYRVDNANEIVEQMWNHPEVQAILKEFDNDPENFDYTPLED